MTGEDENPHHEERTVGATRASWARIALDHPLLSAILILCMIAGALLAWAFLPTELSTIRRLIGGALLGLLSWLIVMMGRMLD